MKEKYVEKKMGNGSSDSRDLLAFIEEIESNPENHRINPEDFIGLSATFGGRQVVLFTEEDVKRDLAAVKEKMNRILSSAGTLPESQREADVTADFVETMIPQAVRELGWLGDQVKVIHPSLYDDLFRGIDMAVQMLPDREIVDGRDMRCLGFSIDFTISREGAEKKFFDEVLPIAAGHIPAMKYFKASFKTKDGEQTVMLKDFKIPKVIMTCTGEALEEAKEDFLSLEEDQTNPQSIEKVNNNPLRFYFIKETQIQLRFFISLAEKVGNLRVRDLYAQSLRAFEEIISRTGLSEELISEKTARLPSLISKNFDLDANNGQFLQIIKEMAKSHK